MENEKNTPGQGETAAAATPKPALSAETNFINKPASILDVQDIIVDLTYNLTDPATRIQFVCDLVMAETELNARQAFYAQPEADQARGRYAYHVGIMAAVTKKVNGLPGFELRANEAGRTITADAVRAYFATPSYILEKIAADFIDQYSRQSQPVEFFR